MIKPTKENIMRMLRESNFIESEWDRYSLAQAHNAWLYLNYRQYVTTNVIKEAHRRLMKGKPIEQKYKGDWRDVPVWIGGVQKSQPKIVIDSLMRDYCDVLNLCPSNVLEMHIKFESIHPFIDGNGRIGRMLMNWHSLQRNEGLIIFTAEKKQQYYYPIFSNQDRHKKNAIEYAKELHNDEYCFNRKSV